MTMPGRSYTSENYRFGFNGMEKDDEIAQGNLDFGARIYDSRIGRWLSPNMFEYEYCAWSPFNFAADNPMLFIDPDGNRLFISLESFNETSNSLQLSLPSDLDGFISISRTTGEVTLHKEKLTEQHLNDPAVQLLINTVETSEIYYIETSDFAKGISRETGELIEVPVYDNENNYKASADVNLSTNDRGDKEDYFNCKGNFDTEDCRNTDEKYKEESYEKLNALPSAQVKLDIGPDAPLAIVDGQVTVPKNRTNLISPSGRTIFGPAILLHSLAEVYERTHNSLSIDEAHSIVSKQFNMIKDDKGLRGGVEDGTISFDDKEIKKKK